MVFKRIVAVLLWLLVTLTSAFGFMASELEPASGDFFCGTLVPAGQNDLGTREQCRINGWLNYDTTSGYTVAENKIDDAGQYLYHYTSKSNADNILAKGFDTKYSSDGFLYFTDNPSLTPLQAHIDLALPGNRALPDSILKIDVGALRNQGITPALGPRTATGLGDGFGAGGGTEILFNQNIPTHFITPVR